MKLSRLLLIAAAGAAATWWLTRTEKGNEVRRNIADRSGEWAKKLRNLRSETADYAEDFLDDATNVASKARKRADNQMA